MAWILVGFVVVTTGILALLPSRRDAAHSFLGWLEPAVVLVVAVCSASFEMGLGHKLLRHAIRVRANGTIADERAERRYSAARWVVIPPAVVAVWFAGGAFQKRAPWAWVDAVAAVLLIVAAVIRLSRTRVTR